MLRIGFVPGVSPDKWFHRWAERYPGNPLEYELLTPQKQRSALLEGRFDLCFVRLPFERELLHLIPLYREIGVVVVPRDHEVTAFDELELKDLIDENLLPDTHDSEAIEASLDLVQAGIGLLLLPQSLARHHHRKELQYRPVLDAAGSEVGLAWLREREDSEIEEFIGVVRGRTLNSSRQESSSPQKPGKKSTGQKPKTADKQRQGARRSTGKPATRLKRSRRPGNPGKRR